MTDVPYATDGATALECFISIMTEICMPIHAVHSPSSIASFGLNPICGIADMSRPLVGPNSFQKSANLERNMHFEFRPKTTQERLPPFLVCKKHF